MNGIDVRPDLPFEQVLLLRSLGITPLQTTNLKPHCFTQLAQRLQDGQLLFHICVRNSVDPTHLNDLQLLRCSQNLAGSRCSFLDLVAICPLLEARITLEQTSVEPKDQFHLLQAPQ